MVVQTVCTGALPGSSSSPSACLGASLPGHPPLQIQNSRCMQLLVCLLTLFIQTPDSIQSRRRLLSPRPVLCADVFLASIADKLQLYPNHQHTKTCKPLWGEPLYGCRLALCLGIKLDTHK